MYELESVNGYPLLTKVVRDNYRHSSLTRADTMREFLITVLTNKGFEKLLKHFTRRQTLEQFGQQIKITNATLSPIGKRLFRRYVKASRVTGIYKRIESPNPDQTNKLIAKCDSFYGKRSIEDYLSKFVNQYSLLDPNGFYALHFKAFTLGEEPEVYPVLWPCTSVVHYHYSETGVLHQLLIKIPRTVATKFGNVSTVDYLLYEQGRQTTFTEAIVDIPAPTETAVLIRVSSSAVVDVAKKSYWADSFDTLTDEIPARRLGYEVDVEDNNLMVSPIYAAEPHFRDYIDLKSKLDVTMLLHVYAKLFEFAKPCPGESTNRKCNAGIVAGTIDTVCSKCKGNGYLTPQNGMETLYFDMPESVKEMIPLKDMAFYHSPDIKVVDKLEQRLYELEYQKIPITIFGTEVLIRSNGGGAVVDNTATEALLSADQLNDTLRPFVDNVSELYVFTVRTIAAFNDIADVNALYTHPSDLAVESTAELLNQLKLANESGANGPIVELLNDRTMLVMLRDKPNELLKYKTQQKFIPLAGKSLSERQFLLGSNLIPERTKILYAMFDSIFLEIDVEQQKNKVDFYGLTYEKQNELLEAKLTTYVDAIKAATPAPAFNIPARVPITEIV